jgi:hypothetical protein
VGAEGGRQDAFWRTLGEVGSKDILFLNPRWIREGYRKKYVPDKCVCYDSYDGVIEK